jgi:GT2 family glycosyltransferase/glycosyltransferase involved in cell wall biosynthesis
MDSESLAAAHRAIDALTAPELGPLFWPPSRITLDSAWYGHVPFAHWLIGQHRPASIVELGTHNGVSYAAFCDAVLNEKLDARAIAVDTWKGDEHAGFYGDEVYEELRKFHDHRYAAFSTLMRCRFDEALAFVPDGSIDLLHIDGRHRYEDVSEDFHGWVPKLSARAVVLFHDTNVRERDFGVWRLWSEVSVTHPSFEFLHGHGLGVLALGREVGGAVAALCALRDPAAIGAVRERFGLLGERWIAGRDVRLGEAWRADLQAKLDKTKSDMAATKEWADAAQTEVNKLFPLYEALQETHRGVRSALARARYDVSARQREIAELAAARAASEAEFLREAQALRARLEAAEARAALAEQRVAETDEYAALVRRELHGARAEIAALAEARAQLMNSTSWRLTAPLRRLMGGKATSPLPPAPPPAIPAPPDVKLAPAPPAEQPAPVAEAEDEADAELGTHYPSFLFISGEDYTPGHFYRVERYVAAARALGLDAGWTLAGPVGPKHLAAARMVVLWRVPYSSHIAGIIQVAREYGATVLFDVDDLMFRPELATIQIIDGIRSQRFSEVDTGEFFRLIAKTLRACDLVTCPTEELAHQIRQSGRPAYVLPNGFDETVHREARRAHRDWLSYADDIVRIGYAGGSRTHQRDFAQAAPAVARVLRAHPQTRLTLFRDPSSNEGLVLIDEFPEFAELADRIEWRNMVKLAELPGEIARFAINLAPLEVGNPFCEAKSELKFFEAALAGVPTVASPTGPFRRAIEHGVSGLLATTEDEWHAALTRLVTDAPLRARMAQAAYHVSLGRFGPITRAQAFARMLAQIEGGMPGAGAFEQDLYRRTLPASAAPHVPDARVLFARDMMGDAAVTVILPVFNYADYVPEALASVADQTLGLLDLVVIDDASPDDSGQMVLDWVRANEARFNRIRVLRHVDNAGLGFARNSGFAAAETPFVLALDADNRLRPRACERLLAALESGFAAYAYPGIQQFGDKDEVFGQESYSVLKLQPGNYIDAMALVRKSAWAEAGGYDHVRFGWEDFDLWARIAERGGFGVNVPEVLADYRVHASSMLHTTTEKRENREALADDLERRHPWLDLGRGLSGPQRGFGQRISVAEGEK